MLVTLLVAAMALPGPGLIGSVEGTPLVDVTVELASDSKTATVTHDDGMVLMFEGTVTVEPVQSMSVTTFLSASTNSGWEAVVVPEQITSNNPMTHTIYVDVAVPAGTVDGHLETVTVRASSQVFILDPSVDTDSAEITVKNTSPKPEWDVKILDPMPDSVYNTDNLVINGTASFNLGTISSVEVKVCTGPWTEATGTSQWTIDYDCSYLNDGEHTVQVRARSGEDVSPTVEITVTQERTQDQRDGGPGVSSGSGDEGTPLQTYLIVGGLVVAGLVGAYLVYRRRQREEVDYIANYA